MPRQFHAPPQRHSSIAGIGIYRPRRTVSNAEVCRTIDSTEEWIATRSGIRTRAFAEDDETLLAMATAAGVNALKNASVDASAIDCVLVASMSNLLQTPPLSIAVAYELGTPRTAGIDISAACAGFPHALGIASDMVSSGTAQHVLVIGAERMTDIVDPTDRTVAFLFADGAGAVVVSSAASPAIGPTLRGADGTMLDALRMNTTWAEFRADPTREKPAMKMDGKRVFRWALDHVVPAGRKAIEAAGIGIDDLGAFIPHQANLRMIDIMAERLGLPATVAVARNVTTTGNTSSASIPLAMAEMLCSGAAQPATPALLVGFGAGLNYAAQVVMLPQIPG